MTPIKTDSLFTEFNIHSYMTRKMKIRLQCFIVFALTNFSVSAQILDLTFGNSGKVTTHIGNLEDAITSIVQQPDGKIVACGVSEVTEEEEFRTYVCRYNTNGTLDTSFGTNGKVGFDYLFHEVIDPKIKLQSDGKILIATNVGLEWWEYDFLLVRLNADGSYDSGFGTNGIVITNFEESEHGNSQNTTRAIELQPDGKIILAGESGDLGQFENFAVARYNSDGTLDTTFGSNGKLSINIGTNSIGPYSIDGIYAVKLQSNGKIILAGYTDAQNSIEVYNSALVRLNTDGTIDTSFGTNGKTITNIPASSGGVCTISITNENAIIAGSIINFNSNGNTKIGLLKYDSNGNLDTTFGTNGITMTQINDTAMIDTIWDIALQQDGKIVAAGYSLNTTIDMVVLRYTSNGVLDTAFDTDGILVTDFASAVDGALSLLIQPDGKIVVGGLSGTAPDYEFALARYTFDDLGTHHSVDNRFSVYPNPTTNLLNIGNTKNIDLEKITITDLSGKKITELQGNVFQVNVENLEKGIYFLEMIYEGGKQIEKFIKGY